MIRKIETIKKTYFIRWTASDLCFVFQLKNVQPEELKLKNRHEKNKFIRDLFLLACESEMQDSKESRVQASFITSFANRLRKIDKLRSINRRVREVENNIHNSDQVDNTSINIDRLQARLFYLMTQYSMHPCRHLASHIIQQLTDLCQHPHIELMPAQQHVYSQSINVWRSRLLQPQGHCSGNIH